MRSSDDNSAINKIANATISRADSPTIAAQTVSSGIGSAFNLPPDAVNGIAQGVQMAWDGGVAFSEEFMGAAHRQHALESAPTLVRDDEGNPIELEHLSDNGEIFTYNEDTGETDYHAAQDNNSAQVILPERESSDNQEVLPEQETGTNQQISLEQDVETGSEAMTEQETGVEQELMPEQETGSEREIPPEQDTETTKQGTMPEQKLGTEQKVSPDQEADAKQENIPEQETDAEQRAMPEQETGIEQNSLPRQESTSPEQRTDSSPSNDGGYDYSGYGY